MPFYMMKLYGSCILQLNKGYYNTMVKINKMLGRKNPEQDAKDVMAIEKTISKVVYYISTLGGFTLCGVITSEQFFALGPVIS